MLFSFMAAWSQGRVVTGRITGQNGEALPGVTVLVKGTGTATTSGSEGRDSVNVSGSNNVLVFSYVGNKTQEITIGDQTSIDVSLQEETSTLNVVVVAGYTTQRRRDVTGSISSVWLTGPVILLSNVNLHLQKNALLQFTTDLTQYPLVEGNWEGLPQMRNQSPISAINATNIAITGFGIIDGAGDAWRMVKKREAYRKCMEKINSLRWCIE